MDRRFSLASVLVVLLAGAIFLWLNPQQAAEQASADTGTGAGSGTVRPDRYILALSWEPAFCEGAMDKPECRTQTSASPDATRLSLHGLWPDDEYCGVAEAVRADDKSGRWDRLPSVDLSPAARRDLDAIMPGTRSGLERHEWIKHGTCAGIGADTYFSRAALFAGTIATSAVGKLFASRIGNRLDRTQIRAAFDLAFGDGAGDRVRVACTQDGDRRLISEITVGLKGDVMGDGGIGELIAAAAPTDPGCSGGIVDRVGRQ